MKPISLIEAICANLAPGKHHFFKFVVDMKRWRFYGKAFSDELIREGQLNEHENDIST